MNLHLCRGRKFISLLIFAVLLAFGGVAIADTVDIKVLGLFSEKALLKMNGKHKVMRVGEVYEGIKLISADSKYCVIQKDNELITLTLGSDLSVQFQSPSDAIVRIEKDSRGMYRTSGKINGEVVNFLVDTGATQLALNRMQAEMLKIDLQPEKRIQVQTASGKTYAYQVTLHSVKVGDIVVYDVPALVVDGEAPYDVLLGMSFLKRIELKDKDLFLELRQKY